MGLSDDLIAKFVKITKDDDTKTKNETTVYGTTVKTNDITYVKLDGSELLTPVAATADTQDGERVMVLIKNHNAIITGNMDSPAARTGDVQNINVNKLDANQASITYATIAQLKATNADVDELSADHAEFVSATVESLQAVDADVTKLSADHADFVSATAKSFEAVDAKINNLVVGDLDAVYANIDFSNIGKAAMEYFYSQSGLIKDVVVGDATITGKLTGVTISGDLVEGNTIKAEKLVIKGSDGLYYKLNTDGMKVEAEQTDENSINGQVIKAKSITATKIDVKDLVAFDATIGGFNITDSALYSGVKESVGNTTRGIYLDKDGQMAIGDANNYIKYFKDTDGSYKLAISAKSIAISGGDDIESEIANLKSSVDDIEIGGRNLLIGTKDLSGFYPNAATPATEFIAGSDGYTYAKFPIATSLSYRAISSTYSMLEIEDVINRQVTFSFELRSDTAWTSSGSNIIIGMGLCNDSNTTRLKYRSIYLTGDIGTEWVRFEVGGTLTEDYFNSGTGNFADCTRFYVQIYNYSLNQLQVRKPQLEYGNRSTDWSPSPDDMFAAIDNISVGGRNLLRKTNPTKWLSAWMKWGGGSAASDSDGWITVSNTNGSANYGCYPPKNSTFPYVGSYILSFEAYSEDVTSLDYNYIMGPSSNTKINNVTITSVPTRYVITITRTSTLANCSVMLGTTKGTSFKIRNIKLEYGNKPTDYTEAPEDIDSDISDASKTATNFITYDSSNGLQLGNKSSGSWTGFRTQITNAAYRILNSGGTVLASYGEKLVELGRNATDAVIKLCGGKGQIEYITDADTSEQFMQVSADKLRLKSSQKSSLYSMYTNNFSRWEKSAVNVTPTNIDMYASECIDPTLVEKVEGWTQSDLSINGTDISASAPNKVTLSGGKGIAMEAGSGPIELRPISRLYSSRQIIVSTEEKTKHNDGIRGWYIGTDGTAHATHETGGPIIAFHFAGSTANTSTIAESAAGEIKINGMRFGVNKVLWSGASYMNGTQTAPLSEAISKQTNGIVLVWSYFSNGAAQDHSFNSHFVSKYEVAMKPGCSHTFLMAINAGLSTFGAKYVTINDDSIVGHATNVSTGTADSGIKFSNDKYVLRYVIGV